MVLIRLKYGWLVIDVIQYLLVLVYGNFIDAIKDEKRSLPESITL